MTSKTNSVVVIDPANVPDISKLKPAVLAIGNDYWTPEGEGEYKNCFVLGIEDQEHQRMGEEGDEIPESIILACVVIAEQTKDGYKQWANGSKRLVGTIEDALKNGTIEAGITPLQITYIGKKKNQTNSFKSDSWDIRPMVAA